MPVAQHPLLAPRFYFAYQLAFFRVTAFDAHVIRHQVFHGVVFKPCKVFRMPRFLPTPGRRAICAGYCQELPKTCLRKVQFHIYSSRDNVAHLDSWGQKGQLDVKLTMPSHVRSPLFRRRHRIPSVRAGPPKLPDWRRPLESSWRACAAVFLPASFSSSDLSGASRTGSLILPRRYP